MMSQAPDRDARLLVCMHQGKLSASTWALQTHALALLVSMLQAATALGCDPASSGTMLLRATRLRNVCHSLAVYVA